MFPSSERATTFAKARLLITLQEVMAGQTEPEGSPCLGRVWCWLKGCSSSVWFMSKISRARHVYCANISSAFLLWAVHQSLNTEISPASPTPPCLISFSAVGELKQNTTQSEPDITNVCKDKTLFKGTQLTSSGQVLVLKENHGKLLTGKWFKIISARTKYLKKVLKRRKVLVRPTPWQCST